MDVVEGIFVAVCILALILSAALAERNARKQTMLRYDRLIAAIYEVSETLKGEFHT